jgi:HSP20 family molecular chaperone IbpA
MNGYPRDMFEEMDEVFDHLFARMQRDMFSHGQPASGYRIVIENRDNNTLPLQDLVAAPPRISANPKAEVHRINEEVKVIAELPGATSDSIRLDVQGRILIIEAVGIDAPYHTIAEIPLVDAGTMQSTFRNGVLEVTLQALPEPAETA